MIWGFFFVFFKASIQSSGIKFNINQRNDCIVAMPVGCCCWECLTGHFWNLFDCFSSWKIISYSGTWKKIKTCIINNFNVDFKRSRFSSQSSEILLIDFSGFIEISSIECFPVFIWQMHIDLFRITILALNKCFLLSLSRVQPNAERFRRFLISNSLLTGLIACTIDFQWILKPFD